MYYLFTYLKLAELLVTAVTLAYDVPFVIVVFYYFVEFYVCLEFVEF